MAYTNKVSAVGAVLFLAVVMAQRLADAQSEMSTKMDPKCATVMHDLHEKCFTIDRVTPTEDCCSDLKSANTTQVTCLCDNYVTDPNNTGPYTAGIITKCSVFDKYSCNGTSKGGEEKNEKFIYYIPGKKKNGVTKNTIDASTAVFGLVASLFFFMF